MLHVSHREPGTAQCSKQCSKLYRENLEQLSAQCFTARTGNSSVLQVHRENREQLSVPSSVHTTGDTAVTIMMGAFLPTCEVIII